jgi:paraquat-inducible protein B
MTEPLLPTVRKRSGFSLVWLIPLIAAALGAWLIFHTLSQRGPLVTITFRTADGIEVQKTKIKYKSLDIGAVETVSFSSDFSRIEVRARLNLDSAHFLKADTRFWVVRPSLSLHGISGLGTLLSGAYIEIEPGQGQTQTAFVGMETPPVVTAEQAGTRVTLLASRLGSIDRGSLVYYQGIVAGQVLGYEMAANQRNVMIYAFVKAPFERLLRSNTLFWNSSGVDVSVGPEGMRVKTESVRSLLFGGIAFDTPRNEVSPAEDVTGLTFTLHDDFKSIQEKSYTSKIRFVMYFEDSVRGLSVGAPVEYKGIKIGSVVSLRLEDDARTSSLRIPVEVELEPERVVRQGEQMKRAPLAAFQTMVKRGLRARLQTGSLLTGQLYVDLDLQPDAPLRLIGHQGAVPELPTVQADLEKASTTVRGILNKLDKVDLLGISKELHGTLKGANALANHKEIERSLSDLSASLATLRSLAGKIDQRADPVMDQLGGTLSAARSLTQKIDQRADPVMDQLGGALSAARSLTQKIDQRVDPVMDQLGGALSAARSLTEKIDQRADPVMDQLGGALSAARSLTQKIDQRADPVMDQLGGTLSAARSLTQKIDQRVDPVMDQLGGVLSAARVALDQSKTTMTLVDAVLEPESPSAYALMKLMRELTGTARSIRALVDLLEREPQSMVFGRRPTGEGK